MNCPLCGNRMDFHPYEPSTFDGPGEDAHYWCPCGAMVTHDGWGEVIQLPATCIRTRCFTPGDIIEVSA